MFRSLKNITGFWDVVAVLDSPPHVVGHLVGPVERDEGGGRDETAAPSLGTPLPGPPSRRFFVVAECEDDDTMPVTRRVDGPQLRPARHPWDGQPE